MKILLNLIVFSKFLLIEALLNEWEDKDLSLKHIVQALIDKERTFMLDQIDGNGYHIQA